MRLTLGKTLLAAALSSALIALLGCGKDNQTILPVQNVTFGQFEYTIAAGPCGPGADCSGFITLDSHGTLSYDKLGEVPSDTIHTTTVTQAELDNAVAVLTNRSLVTLLDFPGPLCATTTTDLYENMTLITAETITHSHEVTACQNQPIANARQTLQDLANHYFP